jgi:hypothetical protein
MIKTDHPVTIHPLHFWWEDEMRDIRGLLYIIGKEKGAKLALVVLGIYNVYKLK